MRGNPVKTPLAFVLMLIVVGSSLVLIPGPAFAQPPCGATLGASLTMTGNLGPCPGPFAYRIGASGITLNCAGFTITGAPGAIGILLPPGRTGVTVENCTVRKFAQGFLLNGANLNLIKFNRAFDDKIGFQLSGSAANVLVSNVAKGTVSTSGSSTTAIGYYLVSSKLNTLVANSALFTVKGVYLTGSTQNTLIQNIANQNTMNGFYFVNSHTNYVSSNTANSNGFIGTAGIGFDNQPSSTLNNLIYNTANSNSALGYADYSNGTLTSGTDNTYAGNYAANNGVHGSAPQGLGALPTAGCTPVGVGIGPQC